MEYPDSMPDGWEVVSWGDPQDVMHDATRDGSDYEIPTDDELADSWMTVVHTTDSEGVDHYYTVMLGVDGYEGLADAIADIEAEYG